MKKFRQDDPIFSDGEEPTPGLLYDVEIRTIGIKAAAELSKAHVDQPVEFTVVNSAHAEWTDERLRSAIYATALILREHLGANPTLSFDKLASARGNLKFRVSYSFRRIIT